MSRATKRKHVMNRAIQDYFKPPTSFQKIVRVIDSKGNNCYEVQNCNLATYTVCLTSRFSNNVWVARGDFIIIQPVLKFWSVKDEMVRVLSKEHIKYFKKIKVWPEVFNSEPDSDDDFRNVNSSSHSQLGNDSTETSETDSDSSKGQTNGDNGGT